MRTRIKICCISSREEAKLAIDYGADALGLVGKMPSGPGPIDDALIAAISKSIHPPVSTFLLTSEQTANGIISHIKNTNTSTIQIVDELLEGTYQQIRNTLPHIRIVQVIHVNGAESIQRAIDLEHQVDAILLDSGNPNSLIKTLGGTGQKHDWNISKKIVENISIPVFLAGGLHSQNVVEAISIVRPFAVDVCSGVRTNGHLDPIKLKAFIEAVQTNQ